MIKSVMESCMLISEKPYDGWQPDAQEVQGRLSQQVLQMMI